MQEFSRIFEPITDVHTNTIEANRFPFKQHISKRWRTSKKNILASNHLYVDDKHFTRKSFEKGVKK